MDEIDAAVRQESENEVRRETSLAMDRAVAPEEPSPPKEREFVPERKPFEIDWTSGSGRRYRGSFISRIANVKDHMLIGAFAAQFRGGAPIIALDQNTIDLSEMVATIQVIVEPAGGTPPDWFKNIVELKELPVIELIYEEVSRHWNIFRNRGRSEG